MPLPRSSEAEFFVKNFTNQIFIAKHISLSPIQYYVLHNADIGWASKEVVQAFFPENKRIFYKFLKCLSLNG
jgi:hypothetical protein